MKVKKFWLLKSEIQNPNYAKELTAWRKLVTPKKLIIGQCEAANIQAARKQFKLKGFHAYGEYETVPEDQLYN